MTEPTWLGAKLIVDIHGEQLAPFGGPEGTRDHGMLESALGRPVNEHAHGETNLATLAFGLARNHPSIDGSKRVAFAALLAFPGPNGGVLRVEPAHATASMLALASGEIEEEAFARWVKDHTTFGIP